MTVAPDPGAVATADRVPAPDLARGGMLLLIALANVHVYVYGLPAGPRSYPRELSGVDAAIAAVQIMLVDGRAYPLFALLFGYGIWQLTARRTAAGRPSEAVVHLVRRRGWWMVLIGFLHALLLWAGDIVGAYGLTAVLFAGLLVAGSDRALVRTAVIGTAVSALALTGAALPPPPGTDAALPSMAIESVAVAAAVRLGEWLAIGLVLSVLIVFGAVALGALAARHRILDEPQRHRTLLVRLAVAGITIGVIGGLPLALMVAAGRDPGLEWLLLAGALHGLSGYAGAIGYAAVFGLVAAGLAVRTTRPARTGGPRSGTGREFRGPGSAGGAHGASRAGAAGWTGGAGGTGSAGGAHGADGAGTAAGPAAGPAWARALQACGQRSLSCYLAQSVAFVALLPAWTLGLGDQLPLWAAALVAAGVWLVILLIADVSARRGIRGPAEVLLRRLTYGPSRP
ncbi:MAG: DUF418 domain-containing protein [Pseudonocardia sp.]